MSRYRALTVLTVLTVLMVLMVPGAAQEKKEEKKDEKKWDVADPLGPTTKLEFETSEGTWMNVDVSPDGQRIVFDLLGDRLRGLERSRPRANPRGPRRRV
ncbi:MAG: hypothetical protein ACRD2A_00215 [Vicinamibacterales bacterium]